ncbi:hypothetical protein IGI04_006643 [Brassica rapa subsp. trilocularis]|uniref:Uncharacterized protein n=1 Tax=Brassica rapa subsp. trilocularis TaxID=1813537 RepID=A0ABQ7NKQ9_BRACM|nr:hypothetical protein IGI04_006643 [Brassica rapa subsp. trilocularis]
MAMMVTTPPSCLRPPPDPPLFTPSDYCLCSYSTGIPCPSSMSHDVTKNIQFEHKASSLNLAARALSIDKEVEEAVSFSSAQWLLYLGNIPLLVTGASLSNDHYSFLIIDILLLWSLTQHRRLYIAPTAPISCIISELKTCRMATISVMGVSFQLMMFKDKTVLYLKIHLVLFRMRTSGSPSCPPNGVFLVICLSPLLHFMFFERRTLTMSIFVFGEMAFYVMPDELSRVGVLDSTLFDQGNLMELSSYVIVLASTASPNSLLLVSLEIHQQPNN